MTSALPTCRVALACGGTGGHLFPGLAVAHELAARGAAITLFVSPKEVDRQAVQGVPANFRVVTLPAVGLSSWNGLRFASTSWKGFRSAARYFRDWHPDAVLAMGGFTSAPPILAGRHYGARTFLHESNTVPGRANRWLARVVDECFVGFAAAGPRLKQPCVSVTGTPVRPEFRPQPAGAARTAIGLLPEHPVLLIMGGSQGAHGVNQLVTAAVPELMLRHPCLQFFHLTGASDFDAVQTAYLKAGVRAKVRPFFDRMEVALAAATVAISRSGASSLAEIAALSLPTVLVPFPAAADDHQRHNAAAFTAVGAAIALDQATASGGDLAAAVDRLLRDDAAHAAMAAAAGDLGCPQAAADIAERIWKHLNEPKKRVSRDNPFRSPGIEKRPLKAMETEAA